MRRRGLTWIVYLMFFVAISSFIVVPFSGDVEVFLGSSRLADYFGKGLVYNSFNVWEIKGVFLRLFFYLGYSLTRLFAPCPSMSFSIILSALYALLVILSGGFIARVAVSNKRDRLLFTALFCTAFFAVDTWSKMQAEMTGALLMLVALALAMGKGKRELLRLIVSGVLIGFLFWFKVPLLLLSVSFAAGFMLLSKKGFKENAIKVLIIAAGAVVSLLLVGALVYCVNPDEYSRMLLTAVYQNTLFSGNGFSVAHIIKSFVCHFMLSMLSMPVMYIGLACLIINFIETIREKEYATGAYHFVMWIIPAIYVVLSNCYFVYHYLTFVFASMIEIWILLDRRLNEIRETLKSPKTLILPGAMLLGLILSHALKPVVFNAHINWILGSIGALLLAALFCGCLLKKGKRQRAIQAICVYVLLIYFTYSALFSSNALTEVELTASSYNNDISLPMEENEQVLYLDAGVGAYYLGRDTYYEEYYPLILQRIDEGSERSRIPRYVDASEKILSYSGDYICLMDEFIFPDGKNPTLKKKIEEEYELYQVYRIYYPPETIFSRQSEADMHQLCIYRRKNAL